MVVLRDRHLALSSGTCSKMIWHFISLTQTLRSILMTTNDMIVTGKTYEEVESTLVTQGEQALLWYRNNFLLANPDKFQSLTINPRNIDADKKGSVLAIANERS